MAADAARMDGAATLARLRALPDYQGQLAHVEAQAARPARFAEPAEALPEALRLGLAGCGIERLYCHQVQALEALRGGQGVVVVTGTASGKTLCYNLPVFERLLAEPLATALYLFPTKALTQDQLRGLDRLRQATPGADFLAGVYDGDTPATLRRRLRDSAQILLTNPDMLHTGILPQHPRWNRFFSHLRYVVVDEIHAYRGVFGSHLANVLRRLRRICTHYGAQPLTVACSATIANPAEHAAALCGGPMTLVDDDGSPRGPRQFAVWNPPPLTTAAAGNPDDWRTGGDRRGALGEAAHLMTALVRDGVPTIAFVRTRLASELLCRLCRTWLGKQSRKLAAAVTAYRGGYLPEERRAIERALAAGEILGVASTNALELGIDIGSLDACILVGYPGTVASLWQRAGRAGRARGDALVLLVAQNSPVDQYLAANPAYLLGQSPEEAIVDPDNPHVVIGHLKCAVAELPVHRDEVEGFGAYAATVLELLAEAGLVRLLDEHWYWASTEFAAGSVSLRHLAGPVYTIQDDPGGGTVIGTLDESSAWSQLHTHAVYLHGAETWFVTNLDIEQKIAHVERRDLDYYTQAVQCAAIRIDDTERQDPWGDAVVGFGDVTVTTSIPMFKKVRFHSRESVGWENLELPPQLLETVALWLAPPPPATWPLPSADIQAADGLTGLANLLSEVAPLFVMCDPGDIGAVVDHDCLGRDAVFLYDRYPGGMGFARRCRERLGEVLAAVGAVVAGCPCERGCPSCVGAASPSWAMGDLDRAVRDRIPDKRATVALLAVLSATVAIPAPPPA